MTLLGSFIDVRTIASIAANGSASFTHGLPASPDFVIVFGNASLASATTVPYETVFWDATNVTIQNGGSASTANPLKVTSVVAHSIIR